MGDVLSLRLL